MSKKETPLNALIKESGLKKEFIIQKTGINRSDFYKGIKYPVIFSDAQLKEIAKCIGVKVSVLNALK